jgi:hypothetical protein
MLSLSNVNNPAKLREFAQKHRLLQFSSVDALVNTTGLLHRVVLLSDKILVAKAYLDLVRELQAKEGRPRCFEDEFVLAVAYLGLEVSKVSHIVFLKGESPDFRPTKARRQRLQADNEADLKALSAQLGRPNEQRGATESGFIEAAHSRLALLVDLQDALPEVVKVLSAPDGNKRKVFDAVRIGTQKRKMTETDYDIIVRMARREKVIVPTRKKDPESRYQLSDANHERMTELADKLGVTPRRALNKVLDDFFSITEKHRHLGTPRGKTKSKRKD